MTVSRRRLLTLTPVVLALAACAGSSRTTVNVRDHGAVGDGSHDDSAAIIAAAKAMKSGSNLYFPKGSYRFAQRTPPGKAAIALTGLSDFDIRFDPDAELVMDNLDPVRHTGTSHGIFIQGPSSRISLQNIKIRWAQQPSERSFGDGIRLLGYPAVGKVPAAGWNGAPTPINGVTISDCDIKSAPQAGIIVIGASDTRVTNVHMQDTHADGLHFNACRQAKVDGLTVRNAGDDGLALVTYYAEQFTFDSVSQEFAFPSLNDWSTKDFVITNVSVEGGPANRANGARLAGADGVDITGLTVAGMDAGAGVVIDSAAPGGDTGWLYVATRGVRMRKLNFRNCEMGIQLLARPAATGDVKFTDFDVEATDVTIRNCSNWAVRAESLSADLPITGLQLGSVHCEANSTAGGNGGVGIGNAKGLDLGNLSIRHDQPVLAFSILSVSRFHIEQLQITIAGGANPGQVPPCAQFDTSDGIIDELDVSWRQATPTWVPLWMNRGDDCVNPLAPPPVVIRALKVDPWLPTHVFGC
jgi:hypothetical protein